MGKASRRRTSRDRSEDSGASGGRRALPAPFVARPFEGLPSESEWVAMRELLPAATASVTLRAGALPDLAASVGHGGPRAATVTTVLPLAWPAMHRADGELFVATQSGASSGDPSRDLAAALLLAAGAPASTPVSEVPLPQADSPRLQDVLDVAAPFEAQLHAGFEYWVGDTALDAEGQASLERANESVIPTERVVVDPAVVAETLVAETLGAETLGASAGVLSVFWCVIGGRSFVRWVLPFDEDAATDALARLLAGGAAELADDTRLLGAFRAGGLLVPVWDVPDDLGADGFAEPVAALAGRLREALGDSSALTADQRRSRAGLVNRQVTLR